MNDMMMPFFCVVWVDSYERTLLVPALPCLRSPFAQFCKPLLEATEHRCCTLGLDRQNLFRWHRGSNPDFSIGFGQAPASLLYTKLAACVLGASPTSQTVSPHPQAAVSGTPMLELRKALCLPSVLCGLLAEYGSDHLQLRSTHLFGQRRRPLFEGSISSYFC